MSERRALLIGVGQYAVLPKLGSVASDADRLGRVLQDPGVGDFEASILHDPTRNEVESALNKLFATAREQDVLLIHFSGHGLTDDRGKLYLAASDTDPDSVNSTGFSADRLDAMLHGSRSRHVVLLLDVCQASARRLPERPWRPASLPHLRHVALLANYYPGTSLFTRSLVEALQQEQTDLNRDGQIDVSELHKYVGERLDLGPRPKGAALVAAGQVGLPVARATSGLAVADPEPSEWLHRQVDAAFEEISSRRTQRLSQPHVLPKRRWWSTLAASLFGADVGPLRETSPRAERDREPAWTRLQRLLTDKYGDLTDDADSAGRRGRPES